MGIYVVLIRKVLWFKSVLNDDVMFTFESSDEMSDMHAMVINMVVGLAPPRLCVIE